MLVDWTELGIPEDYAWPNLLYNAPAQTVIVEVSPKKDVALGHRILRRRLDESTYGLIGEQAPPFSYEDPITSDRLPLLYFNVVRMQRHEGQEGGVGGDWNGIYRCDLSRPGEAPALVAAESTLRFPEPYDWGFVPKLISVHDDGSRLHAIAGLSQNQGRSVEYHLAVLDLKSCEIQPLSLLRATFF